MARGLAASFVTDRFDRFVTFYRRCVVLYDVISFFIRFAVCTHMSILYRVTQHKEYYSSLHSTLFKTSR